MFYCEGKVGNSTEPFLVARCPIVQDIGIREGVVGRPRAKLRVCMVIADNVNGFCCGEGSKCEKDVGEPVVYEGGASKGKKGFRSAKKMVIGAGRVGRDVFLEARAIPGCKE